MTKLASRIPIALVALVLHSPVAAAATEPRWHVGDWVMPALDRLGWRHCMVLPRLAGLPRADRAIILKASDTSDLLECYVGLEGGTPTRVDLQPPLRRPDVGVNALDGSWSVLTNNTHSRDPASPYHARLYLQFKPGLPAFPQRAVLDELLRSLPAQPGAAFASEAIALAEIPAADRAHRLPRLSVSRKAGGTVEFAVIDIISRDLFSRLKASPGVLDQVVLAAGGLGNVESLDASGAFVVGASLYPTPGATPIPLIDLDAFASRFAAANGAVSLDATPTNMAALHVRLRKLAAFPVTKLKEELMTLGVAQHPLTYLSQPP